MNTTALLLVFTAFPTPDTTLTVSELFESLDANGDGKIVQQEVRPEQRSFFRRALRVADTDQDNALTHKELALAFTDPEPAQPVTPGFTPGRPGTSVSVRQLDRNNDGQLTIDEVPDQLKPRIQQILDRTGQKVVPIQMLKQMQGETPPVNRNSPALPADPAMNRSRSTSDFRAKEAPTRTADAANFSRLDRNQDGRLSRDELPERFRQNFDRLDLNKDRSLSPQELLRAMQSLQNRKQ